MYKPYRYIIYSTGHIAHVLDFAMVNLFRYFVKEHE